MINKILSDGASYPKLVTWIGAPNATSVDEWARSFQVESALDLVLLLKATGGGWLFETEIILPPFETEYLDYAEVVNEKHSGLGLPSDLWIYHEGAWLSAYSRRTGLYCQLDGNYGTVTSYESMDRWYIELIRNEYAQRYGLK